MANRIGIGQQVYGTDFISNRSSRAAEVISREMGLTIANEVHRQKEYLKRNADPYRQQVRGQLQRIAYGELGRGHAGPGVFVAALRSRGVTVEPVKNKRGNVYGLRFGYRGQTFKASEIGREFGLRSLFNQFGITPEGQKGTSMVPVYSQTARPQESKSLAGELAASVLDAAGELFRPALAAAEEDPPEEWYESLKRKKKKRGYGIR